MKQNGSDVTVIKFGGVPMSSPTLIRASARLVKEYPGCACVVVSAPGRLEGEAKVTDLLIAWWETYFCGDDWSAHASAVRRRFESITEGLGLPSLSRWLNEIEGVVGAGLASRDWLVSRGEVLMAAVMGRLLGWPTARAEDMVLVGRDGAVLPESYDRFRLADGPFVLPGFIGADSSGELRTLSRGGSDISGAVAARGVGASLYVNAKDVPGVAVANPGIVPEACYLKEISYTMMHELSVRGAEVLHPDAVAPVEDAGIPILIRSVLAPDEPGTRVVSGLSGHEAPVAVTGRSGYRYFEVRERGMNQRLGAGKTILEAFERRGISFDHVATGQDFMGIAVAETQLGQRSDEVRDEIDAMLSARTSVFGMATVCIVTGRDDAAVSLGPALMALGREGIAPLMVSCTKQGSAIIGVDPKSYEDAIRAVCAAVAA